MNDPCPPMPRTDAECRAYMARFASQIYVRHEGQSLALTELPPDVAAIHVERLVRRVTSGEVYRVLADPA